MFSSLRKLPPLLLLALVTALVAVACGSSSNTKSVPAGAVAVVDDKPIQKSDFDQLMKQAEQNFTAQNQEFPKVGTPEYENVKKTVLDGLIQQAEWELDSDTGILSHKGGAGARVAEYHDYLIRQVHADLSCRGCMIDLRE